MASTTRQFHLRIWALALGYFAVYAPYSAVIKMVTSGLWPGISGPVSGFHLLPATVVATAIAIPAIVWAMGWWPYAGHRRWRGIRVPWPSRLACISGVGTAVIIGATTLAYTSSGVSILLALLLLRGGVLVLAPAIDVCFKRRVRWFSWAALGLALGGVVVALADVKHYEMSVTAALTIAAYLTGYLLRLPCMNTLAKSDDERVTYGYLVEEQMVAAMLLVTVPALWAEFGGGVTASELRSGFSGLFTDAITVPGLLVGGLYACLYFFGTLIYLDRRENTFCIPLNRCASVLSGLVASYALVLVYGQPAPSIAQLGSSGLIIVALLMLSPFHHVERYASRASRSLGEAYSACRRIIGRRPALRPVPVDAASGRAASSEPLAGDSRLPAAGQVAFLFVCSGNTCRSPMAAAIGNAEIAARLGTAFAPGPVPALQAVSAGVSARVGSPMTPESIHALESLGVPAPPHRARSVTAELVAHVEKIFCMTKAHQSALIALVPAAAVKTECLDPDGDIDDPIGQGLPAYIGCAQRIHSLVRLRFDAISPSRP